jgi:hypothetical protein
MGFLFCVFLFLSDLAAVSSSLCFNLRFPVSYFLPNYTRAGLFLLVWIIGFECWFLPNCLMRRCPFPIRSNHILSFLNSPKPGQLPHRIGVGVGLCYWVPLSLPEFDGFVASWQGDFYKDLTGTSLLSTHPKKTRTHRQSRHLIKLDELPRFSGGRRRN